MAEESKGIYTLYGMLFQSPETGMNEIRNSSKSMQREKGKSFQDLRTEKDALRSQKDPEA